MGNVDSMPISSQLKSAILAILGDLEGATLTQHNFAETCVIISQITSAIYALQGDIGSATAAQKKFLTAMDSVPVASQFKSAILMIIGDEKGAKITQENFVCTCLFLSQSTSAVQAILGDLKGAEQTQIRFIFPLETTQVHFKFNEPVSNIIQTKMSEPPENLGNMLLDASIPLSFDDLFHKTIKPAQFHEQIRELCRDKDTLVEDWSSNEDSSFSRRIKFSHPIKNGIPFPGLPSHALTLKVQNFKCESMDTLSMSEIDEVKGVPFSSHFKVHFTWKITAINETTSKVTVFMKVQFDSPTLFDDLISKSAHEEAFEYTQNWLLGVNKFVIDPPAFSANNQRCCSPTLPASRKLLTRQKTGCLPFGECVGVA